MERVGDCQMLPSSLLLPCDGRREGGMDGGGKEGGEEMLLAREEGIDRGRRVV